MTETWLEVTGDEQEDIADDDSSVSLPWGVPVPDGYDPNYERPSTVDIPGYGEIEVTDDEAEAVIEATGQDGDSGVSVPSVGGVGTAILDVPADAINATTGTGENLGWFGVIDRWLDPRASEVGPGEDTFAPPDSEVQETQGIGVGLSAGLGSTGATAGEAASTVSSGLWDGLKRSPELLAAAVVAVLVLIWPYVGVLE